MIKLSCQKTISYNEVFHMNSITQELKYKQSIVKYVLRKCDICLTNLQPLKDLYFIYFDTIQTGIREKDLECGKDVNSVMIDIDNLCSNNNYVFIAQNAKYESNILSHYTDKFRGIAKTQLLILF